MKLLKMIGNSLGVAACLCTSAASADTARISGFVQRTLVSADGTYGGCVVELTQDPADVLPACKSPWITFSCDGTYTDPVRAYRMLDQAQLGLATGMKVVVILDDSKQHNGFCFGSQIKLLSN